MAVWLLVVAVVCLLGYLYYKIEDYREVTDQGKLSILITGCDSGFGYALANQLIDRGTVVFATLLTAVGERHLRSQCSNLSLLHTFILDVRDERGIRSVFANVYQTVFNKGLKFWGLVNNAGINVIEGPSDWLTIDDYKLHMEVNCYGAIRMCEAFKPLLKLSKGRIILMSSIRGRLAIPEGGPYTMSKFALESYGDGLRQDMYYFGIKVSIIEPGGFITALNTNLEPISKNAERSWNNLPENLKKQWPFDCLYSRTRSLVANKVDHRERNISPVVDVLIHALFSCHPKARYVVGRDALYQYLPLLYLPEWLHDWILSQWFTKHWKRPVM